MVFLKTKSGKSLKHLISYKEIPLFWWIIVENKKEFSNKMSFYSITQNEDPKSEDVYDVLNIDSLKIFVDDITEEQIKLIFNDFTFRNFRNKEKFDEFETSEYFKEKFKLYLKELWIKYKEENSDVKTNLEPLNKEFIEKTLQACINDSLKMDLNFKTFYELINEINTDSQILQNNFKIFEDLVKEEFKKVNEVDSNETGTVTSFFKDVWEHFISTAMYWCMLTHENFSWNGGRDSFNTIKKNITKYRASDEYIAAFSIGLIPWSVSVSAAVLELPFQFWIKTIKHIKGSLNIYKDLKEKKEYWISNLSKFLQTIEVIKKDLDFLKEFNYNINLIKNIFSKFNWYQEILWWLIFSEFLNQSLIELSWNLNDYLSDLNGKKVFDSITYFSQTPLNSKIMNSDKNRQQFISLIKEFQTITEELKKQFIQPISSDINYKNIFLGTSKDRINKIKAIQIEEQIQFEYFKSFKDKNNSVFKTNFKEFMDSCKRTNLILFLLTGDYKEKEQQVKKDEFIKYKELLMQKTQEIYEIENAVFRLAWEKIKNRVPKQELDRTLTVSFDLMK